MANAVLDAFYSLGKKINKATGNEVTPEIEEGIVSEKLPELKLDMGNEELLKLTKAWEKEWIESDVFSRWDKQGEDNENYWLGKHFNQPRIDKSRPLVDNVLFQSLETYLPQVTQHNPEPVVTLAAGEAQTPENIAYVTQLKGVLSDIADEIKLRLKLKKTARHWSIYLLGAVKSGWDLDKDMPTLKVVRAKRLILDPKATVDEDGYTGEYIGEHRKMQAGLMLDYLNAIGGEAGYKKTITDLVGDNLGTEVGFIEWWTNAYFCWTLKGKEVLLKKKNPHWNYDAETPKPAVPTVDGQAPEQAPEQPQTQTTKGFNHLSKPSMPYLMLSVYNLGDQPVDNTSLMGQSLANQDLINKRLKQIDKNADSMNGGMVVSLERSGLTMSQASNVTEALRKGGTIAIPAGAVNEAIARMSAPPLPRDVYEQLQDTRSRVQYVFGVRGFTPTQGGGQAAVRSQILNKNLDEARISGGFSEYLEQLADDIYNNFIQLLYVYDEKYAGVEHPKVRLTVKEGSILPKDATALATQAIQLAEAGRMALIDLYKKLEYPNPEETAANVWLEANAPEILFANDDRVKQAIQMKQQAAQGAAKPPSESINFKDLPPEGKAQMASKAGISLHPEAIAAHEEVAANRGGSMPQDQAPAQPELNNGYVQPQ